ncbi:contact-dependent growth inhibition system immunity protein [Mycolicibacterium vaccae]|uniref:contact-dependent growth inhibition system immunity protein n=1 Tax=Mycolicibacterium vaccae TaxID=1810 RepID=UPI003D047491
MDRADGLSNIMSDYLVPYDLDQFFGAYLHQDWDREAEDWQGIVDQYAAVPKRTPQQLRALADHIDELAVRCPDSDLPAAILRMGGFFDPRPEMTFTEWLQQVTERLRRHADALDDAK